MMAVYILSDLLTKLDGFLSEQKGAGVWAIIAVLATTFWIINTTQMAIRNRARGAQE